MSRHATADAPAPRRSARRKVVAITVVGLGIAGLGLASAAQLNLTSGALGAGTRVVASCDSDGVGVAFSNAFDTTAKGYGVTEVKLTGIDAACANQAVKITLLDGDPTATTAAAKLVEVNGTVGTTGGTLTIPVSTSVKAADVKGVAVVISNGSDPRGPSSARLT
jgi:hypothetical protein